jgi:hypothetical protein
MAAMRHCIGDSSDDSCAFRIVTAALTEPGAAPLAQTDDGVPLSEFIAENLLGPSADEIVVPADFAAAFGTASAGGRKLVVTIKDPQGGRVLATFVDGQGGRWAVPEPASDDVKPDGGCNMGCIVM